MAYMLPDFKPVGIPITLSDDSGNIALVYNSKACSPEAGTTKRLAYPAAWAQNGQAVDPDLDTTHPSQRPIVMPPKVT